MTADYVEYVSARLPHLRRVAHALLADPHRADDLVQETITKLYLHWNRASRADNLDAYTQTVLVRTFLDDHRRPWARVRLTSSPLEPLVAPAPGSGEAATVDSLVLRSALARLPRRQRAVLVLRYLADLPVQEVATLLGCSAGTVKSQTHDGLAALRRLLRASSAVEPKAKDVFNV